MTGTTREDYTRRMLPRHHKSAYNRLPSYDIPEPMNYRHAYHAGNFADVTKHLILTALLAALSRKDKPMVYMDTHAGRYSYKLQEGAAAKASEWRDGIGRLWAAKGSTPANEWPELTRYLQAVREINPEPARDLPTDYPGSSQLARALLRPTDRLILCETEAEEYQHLKMGFANDPQTAVHQRDGYEALKAFLPPAERRGLVLIDPPFEETNETDRLLASLLASHERWPTGVFAAWYPLAYRTPANSLHRSLINSGLRRILKVELTTGPERLYGLYGSGMIIINPPWGVAETLTKWLPTLATRLAPKEGRAQVAWLVPE